MPYWDKKSNYKDSNRQDLLDNTINIYNAKLNKWENVNLLDYLNSYDLGNPELLKELKATETIKKQQLANDIMTEIMEVKNINNITEKTDDDEKRIEKFYKIIEKLEAKKKAKTEGQ